MMIRTRTITNAARRPYAMRAALVITGGLALAFISPCEARADMLALYTFTGETNTSTVHPSSDVDINSVASNFTPATGMGSTGNWNSSTNGVDSANGNPAPSFAAKPTTIATQATALSGNSYWSFIVTPESGYELDLTTLTFDLSITNAARPISYYLASNIDGFATPIGTVANNLTGSAFSNKSFSLAGAQFQDITGTIEFRLFLWSTAGGGSSGSAWRFDNVTLNGAVLPVPEPASLALVVAGMTLAAWPRRNKQSSL